MKSQYHKYEFKPCTHIDDKNFLASPVWPKARPPSPLRTTLEARCPLLSSRAPVRRGSSHGLSRGLATCGPWIDPNIVHATVASRAREDVLARRSGERSSWPASPRRVRDYFCFDSTFDLCPFHFDFYFDSICASPPLPPPPPPLSGDCGALAIAPRLLCRTAACPPPPRVVGMALAMLVSTSIHFSPALLSSFAGEGLRRLFPFSCPKGRRAHALVGPVPRTHVACCCYLARFGVPDGIPALRKKNVIHTAMA